MCESEAEAVQRLGPTVAKMLRHRLADIDAAPSLKDLLVGRPRLHADGESIVVDICEGRRLVFTPNHPNNPISLESTDWDKVSRIRILRIETDYA